MIIKTILSNMYPILTTIAILSIFIDKSPNRIQKNLLRWIAGASLLYGGLSHILIPEKAASAIGWKTSPFQKEVGYYDIFVGITCILGSTKLGEKFAPGAILIYSGFSFAAGLNHLYENIYKGNASKNNTGFVLWTDLLVPIVLMYTLLK
ncbi:hypothetical protein N9P79_01105 [Crocinitomicaceae bacterium]|nr:hypothetical protein [Crocinitomicaceae bacterium]